MESNQYWKMFKVGKSLDMVIAIEFCVNEMTAMGMTEEKVEQSVLSIYVEDTFKYVGRYVSFCLIPPTSSKSNK